MSYMDYAINEAYLGIKKGHGGPFGAVIVKNGKIVACGHNKVVKTGDPTCHGEIDAIKRASKKLKTFDLSGCELYTTGEPCPMCLAACKWANIEKVYYGCSIEDNSKIGFRDKELDELFGGRQNIKDYLIEFEKEKCLKLFDDYNNIKNKVMY